MFFHHKIVSLLIQKGKKSKALLIYLYFLKSLKLISKKDPFILILKAINNVLCFVTFKKKAISKKIVEVPIWVTSKKYSISVALKWLVRLAKKQNQKTMILNLVKEFIEASKGLGFASLKKREFYNLARKNKNFLYLLQKKKKNHVFKN